MTAAVLTVAEVAARLRVSRDTAYGLIKSGRLHAIPMGRGGRALRVPEQALQEFLSAKT